MSSLDARLEQMDISTILAKQNKTYPPTNILDDPTPGSSSKSRTLSASGNKNTQDLTKSSGTSVANKSALASVSKTVSSAAQIISSIAPRNQLKPNPPRNFISSITKSSTDPLKSSPVPPKSASAPYSSSTVTAPKSSTVSPPSGSLLPKKTTNFFQPSAAPGSLAPSGGKTSRGKKGEDKEVEKEKETQIDELGKWIF